MNIVFETNCHMIIANFKDGDARKQGIIDMVSKGYAVQREYLDHEAVKVNVIFIKTLEG